MRSNGSNQRSTRTAQPIDDDEPVGLIAGSGQLPLLVAEGVRKAGLPLVVVGLRGQADPALQELAEL